MNVEVAWLMPREMSLRPRARQVMTCSLEGLQEARIGTSGCLIKTLIKHIKKCLQPSERCATGHPHRLVEPVRAPEIQAQALAGADSKGALQRFRQFSDAILLIVRKKVACWGRRRASFRSLWSAFSCILAGNSCKVVLQPLSSTAPNSRPISQVLIAYTAADLLAMPHVCTSAARQDIIAVAGLMMCFVLGFILEISLIYEGCKGMLSSSASLFKCMGSDTVSAIDSWSEFL